MEAKMSDRMQLVIPCKPEYVSTARLAVSSVASKAGFNIEAVEDIKVAVSEACSNIISHSRLCGEDDYRVICTVENDRIDISVEDDGAGFEVAEYHPPHQGEISERGLGLLVVRTLMDETEVLSEEGKGTKFRMTKYLAVDKV
jgi:serine/threonine-protein kinase RsbW